MTSPFRRDPRDDQNALVRYAVLGVGALVRIEEEAANNQIESDEHERNAPELEEERCTQLIANGALDVKLHLSFSLQLGAEHWVRAAKLHSGRASSARC